MPPKEKVVSVKGDEAEELVSRPLRSVDLLADSLELAGFGHSKSRAGRSRLAPTRKQVLNYLIEQNRPYGASASLPFLHPSALSLSPN